MTVIYFSCIFAIISILSAIMYFWRHRESWVAVGMTSFFAMLILFSLGTATQVDYIKRNAPEYFGKNGFEIVACQGYQRTMTLGRCYGGGKVWYNIRLVDDPSILYSCYLARWGEDNIQLLDLKPVGNITVVNTPSDPTLNVKIEKQP